MSGGQTGSTHPTGMFSCASMCLLNWLWTGDDTPPSIFYCNQILLIIPNNIFLGTHGLPERRLTKMVTKRGQIFFARFQKFQN